MAPGTLRRLVDALGLAVLLLVLLDLLRPSLLLLPTITAGGDTPCHYPAAAWFTENLLPALRVHGWYPGATLGHPLFLYYFPLPFFVISGLTGITGLPVAFKLGTVLGVFLLPLLVYAAFRLMRLPFPAPLLGAATALAFLYLEENPIWGGTLASTLTGEFSYTYGVGLAVLFLGVVVRARERGRGPWGPAAALALVASAHGYAVLWAGLTSSFLLAGAPRPRRTLGWLLAVAGLAFALAAPFLLPLLADWGWTTPYDDPWITVSTTGLVPPLLWPFFAVAVVGLGVTLVGPAARRDSRLLLLGFGALVGGALAAAGPTLGIVDVRFVPFAQLSLALTGAASLGLALSRFERADLAALGLVLLTVVYADGRSQVLRHWVDWNYSGLEAKELWPAWTALTDELRGSVANPRVAVEYGAVHERAGSLRMHETLPFFSGRSGIEGVYSQASVMTHPVYSLVAELFPTSPNPFRSLTYSRFDPETALARLPLFGVSHVVTVSDELSQALDGSDAVVRQARVPPYTVYRLRDPGPGYVEPLAFAPVQARREGWREASYRWSRRKPPNRAHLVFTDDPRFEVVQADPWQLPPEIPLTGGVQVETRFGDETIRVDTSRVGHPLLVKVSYHPRWRAEGADGPYLVSPGLMLVVPSEPEVVLRYTARTWADAAGLLLALGAAAGGVWWTVRRRRRAPAPPLGEETPNADVAARLLRSVPVLLVVALAATRLAPAAVTASGDLDELYERASRAFAAGEWRDAAEYARLGVEAGSAQDARSAELRCVQGEALLRAGHPRGALEAFTAVVERGGPVPHRAQALYSGARAREALGQVEGAAEWRRWLRAEFPENPWTERLLADPSPSSSAPAP